MQERIGQPAGQPTPTLTPAAQQITGFRIMRQTEITPGWWGTAREVGETVSATVVYTFCTQQNKVTMDPNRTKRILFYADPITAESDREPSAATQ